MNMKKNRKFVSLFLVSAMLVTAATGFAFAESVPAYMTISGTPSIDVEVSYADPETGSDVAADGIMMTGTADSPVLSITSLKVKNNNTMGIIQVKKVEIATEGGWTVVEDRSDFARMPADSKKFSLVSDDHDFGSGAYTTVREVNPGVAITYEFTGKTGPVSAALDKVHVANAVLTLALK